MLLLQPSSYTLRFLSPATLLFAFPKPAKLKHAFSEVRQRRGSSQLPQHKAGAARSVAGGSAKGAAGSPPPACTTTGLVPNSSAKSHSAARASKWVLAQEVFSNEGHG